MEKQVYSAKRSGFILVIGSALILIIGIITISIGAVWISQSNDNDATTTGVAPLFDVHYMQIKYVNRTSSNPMALINLALSADGRAANGHRLTSHGDNCDFEADPVNPNLLNVCKTISFENKNGEQGSLILRIQKIPSEDENGKNFICYDTYWYSTASWLQPTDCLAMEPQKDYWHGGAEMYYQLWPLNSWNKHMSFFLSGDMYIDDQQYGSLLDRYWLASKGVALFVSEDVPLHISTENNQLCLKGAYDGYPNMVNRDYDWLKYTMCFAGDARSVHEGIMKNKLHYQRPQGLPDLRMVKSPIWSTWARYKIDINQSIVLQYADEILDNGFSNSQLEIDDGYEARYGDFTFEETKFPNATEMIRQLHDRGFRVTTWVTPFINPGSENYDDGVQKGYFVKSQNGNAGKVAWWNGIGSMIDFTNTEACDWYVEILEKTREKYGVDSFKFDAGEINYLTAITDFQTHEEIVNIGKFTSDYAECAYRLGTQIELRASWNTQHLPVFVRMMDKDSNWSYAKGLKTLIPTALTFSVLGYPYILPDMIGGNGYESGFHGKYIPERELYIRWLEITAFLPNMQFSITPWQYDDEVNKIAKKYIDIHEGEIYDEIIEASQLLINGKSSIGPIRPIWWISPLDLNAYNIDDEFLVGEKYLVAPIVNNATTSRDIYLPGPFDSKGNVIKWVDRLRQETVDGGTTLYDYKIDLDEISWWEREPNN